jgi:murein DD-endopeptidase MepM/ murein hydrolase activator NlpD
MSNLLSNGHTLLSGVLFDSDRKGIVYLNDIQFEPPTPGLFTLFDDHLHVQVNRWGNTQLSTTFSEPFAGQNAIKAEFPMAWEGFSLRQTQRVSTDEFGALTFAVKGNQSGQDLLVYAIDEDEDIVGTAVWASDYIHGGVLPTDWQVAWIPLRDLMPGGGDFNGIAVEPSVAGTVWLDEVKVSRGLEFPLKNGWTPWTARVTSVFDHSMTRPYSEVAGGLPDGQIVAWSGEVAIGTPVDQGAYAKLGGGLFSVGGTYYNNGTSSDENNRLLLNYDNHPGIDYANGNNLRGKPVTPAATGTVLPNRCWTYNTGGTCSSWGAVGVDHGNGYITQYWHMSDVQVQSGQQVTTDTVLGHVSDVGIPGQPHLHFEVAKRVGSTYVHVDPYGWAGSFDTDPYTKARNVCLWQTGCL